MLGTEQFRNLRVAVLGEVDAVFLAAALVQDNKVGIVALHPLHFQVLPLLPPLLFFQPATHIIKVI